MFINALNGKDGNLCHLVTVPPGPLLSDALISSPILQGEDGAGPMDFHGSEFGFVDPNADPELALVSGHLVLLLQHVTQISTLFGIVVGMSVLLLERPWVILALFVTDCLLLFCCKALRVSMEEQRQRQEEEARRSTVGSGEETPTLQTPNADSEEAMLQQALSMSAPETPVFDFSAMTEEQQIEYAMRLSLQNVQDITVEDGDSQKEKQKENEEEKEISASEQLTASAMETNAEVRVACLVKCSLFDIVSLHLFSLSNKTSYCRARYLCAPLGLPKWRISVKKGLLERRH